MKEEKVKKMLASHGKNRALAEMLGEKAKILRQRLQDPATARTEYAPSGAPADMADRLAKIEECEAEAARRSALVRMVELALLVLDEEERRVAELCFLAPKSGNVKLLCDALHKERTAVFRLSKKVLEKLGDVLWEAGMGEYYENK